MEHQNYAMRHSLQHLAGLTTWTSLILDLAIYMENIAERKFGKQVYKADP